MLKKQQQLLCKVACNNSHPVDQYTYRLFGTANQNAPWVIYRLKSWRVWKWVLSNFLLMIMDSFQRKPKNMELLWESVEMCRWQTLEQGIQRSCGFSSRSFDLNCTRPWATCYSFEVSLTLSRRLDFRLSEVPFNMFTWSYKVFQNGLIFFDTHSPNWVCHGGGSSKH